MSIYGKGLKGKADRLFSLVVRSRGACQRCGSTDNLQCAHIVRRRYNATRTYELNAWCLCARCHFLTGEQPDEYMALVRQTIGLKRYFQLKRKADFGVKANDVFWQCEIDRLTATLNEREADAVPQ